MVTLESTDHKPPCALERGTGVGGEGGAGREIVSLGPHREGRGAHSGLGQRDRDKSNPLAQGRGTSSLDGSPLSYKLQLGRPSLQE